MKAAPDGERAWAAYRNGLALLDPSKSEPVGVLDVGGTPHGLEIEAKGTRVFTNVPKSGQIAVIDRISRKPLARWAVLDVKQTGPMALDELGKRLFVVCAKPKKIVVLATDTGRAVAWADLIVEAEDAFFDRDRNRLYLTASGTIAVFSFEKDKLKLLANFPLDPTARSAAWIPESSRLCVGVSVPGRDSEVWVYRAMP